ncbi:MAG: phage/plasmid primase, P4 family, partial [Desulfobaccales bacterium]
AQRPGNNGRLDDAALLDRMFTSKSGPKIRALWAGDISGYISHSEADQALCNYLAFWTDRDPAAIDRLFRGSGLYRPDKWGDRSDYRDRTIGAAIAATSEGYHPSPAARGDFIPETLTPREAETWGETGDARLLAQEYRGRLVYDHAAGQWLAWAGHWWEPDRCGAAVKHVSNDIAALYLTEAATARKADDQKTSDALQKRARQLRDRRRCENVLFLAARPYLGIVGDEWDRDPWALGCVNGVLDLKTGTLRPGRPADYIQAHCPTEWAGLDAPAPTWEQCISDVLGGDLELIAFTQRLLGYAVAGLTTEHIFPILWGDGRNGKSTILETLKSVLGDTLAMRTEADALMITGRDVAGDAPKPYLFAMRGKRLCWASESREGRRLDVNLIKTLAGGDTMNVRTLHGRPVSWEPTHTLFLLTNNRPQISPDDRAIWDRVLLIPFTQRFVDDPGPGELQRDPDIKQKLLSEASGILAWLVRGCLEWQRGGLRPPQTVKTQTEEYRREEDTVQQFLDDRCVTTGPGAAVCTTRAGELYAAYKQWGQSSGLEVISSTAFGRRLGKLGYTKDKKPTGLVYQGIGLLP